MTLERTLPDLDQLERAVDELTRGNWRAAKEVLRSAVDAGDEDAVVGVTVSLRCVCRCMWFQCASGDVASACHELDRATTRLVRLGGRATGAGRMRRLQLLPEPALERRLPHLIWATTRLVLREQGDLEAVRVIFESIKRGTPELVYATVEHLTWVAFDPWTERVHPRDRELLGLDDDAYARFRTGNPVDISQRATRLRQLADVRTGSVCRRTWYRQGEYMGMRDVALRVLAKEPLSRQQADYPLRLGRLRAIEYARQLAKDTAA